MALKKIYPNNDTELLYDTATKEYVIFSNCNPKSGQYEKETRYKNPVEAVNGYLSKVELDAQKRLLKAFSNKELGITENKLEGENN